MNNLGMLPKDEDNPYEGKGVPYDPEKDEILKFNHKLGTHLRKFFHLDDQLERLNPGTRKGCESLNRDNK